MMQLRFFRSMTAVIAIAVASSAFAQQAPQSTFQGVAVIDLSQVFDGFGWFTAQKEALANQAKALDADLKRKAEKLQADVVVYREKFRPGSPEAKTEEERLARLKKDLEFESEKARRNLLTRESEIYLDAYGRVRQEVEGYARYFKVNVVIRYNSTEPKQGSSPKAILQALNKNVLWRNAKVDITGPIISELNKRFPANANARVTTGVPGPR